MNSSAATLPLPRRPQPIIPNSRLGTMLLLGTETVLFACFISAYIVLKMGSPAWPPVGTPALHIGLSAINTSILVISALCALIYNRRVRQGQREQAHAWLLATIGLGTLFLGLQGVEFHRLYALGLTLQTGAYGAVFYCLISMHGLHVLGGLGFLIYLLFGTENLAERATGAAMYWYFVTAVWLVLFSILYIL